MEALGRHLPTKSGDHFMLGATSLWIFIEDSCIRDICKLMKSQYSLFGHKGGDIFFK
jgi:hypothetical protein